MRRREVIASGVVVGASAIIARRGLAQAARRARLGYLSGGTYAADGNQENSSDILKTALRELGWRAGETLEIEERWADGDFSRMSQLARELVALRPDVIAATGSQETRSLQAVTRDIPIVFLQVQEPVALGLVASIVKPGGNITGLSQGPQIVWGKRLDLLSELLGRVPRRLTYLGNPGNLAIEADWADARDAAAKIGGDLVRLEVSRASELDPAFGSLQDDTDAVLVQWDFLFSVMRRQIADLAMHKRLPAAYGNRSHVLAGGLMSYGADLRENYRQGAIYVDRILKGARAADLPVVQASRFELVININTARTLGLTIPPTLLARADEVIE
jgi:putative tryptophan/tyrosine transport system substrate-binding protein